MLFKYQVEDKSKIKYNSFLAKINKHKALEELIMHINGIVPPEYADAFYNNVLNLKVQYPFNQSSNDDISSDITLASYFLTTNEIKIYTNKLFHVLKRSMLFKEPFKIFSYSVAENTLHELLHLASTKYNNKTGEGYCGFAYYSDKGGFTNLGITEGFVNITTLRAYPSLRSIKTTYDLVTALTGQLCAIIGYDFVKEEFFKGEGIDNLVGLIAAFLRNEDNATYLFNYIDYCYVYIYNKKTKKENYYYENFVFFQELLLGIFKISVDMKYKKGYDLLRVLNEYETFFITPKKASYLDSNPEKFKYLDLVYAKFLDFKKHCLLKVRDELNRGNADALARKR